MKLCIKIVTLVACVVKFHACAEDARPIDESLFDFTRNLHQEKSPSDTTENLVLSPLGFNLLLGQIAAGANPVLAEAIGKFLGWNKTNLTDIIDHHERLLLTYSSAKDDQDSLQIHINSALFHREYINIQEEFRELLQKHYNTELISLRENATDRENQKIVNDWVRNATESVIKDFPLSANAIALFANVVYFNANWQEPFSHQLTRKGQFFSTPEKIQNATYLMGQQDILYMEEPQMNFKMIQLPYNSSKYNISMYILAPQKHNLREIITQMTLEKFLMYKAKMTLKTVNIKMPKLSLKSKIHIKDTLAKFMDNSTHEDFFALSKVSSDSRSVLSDVVQESTFNVHEKGTTFASLSAGYINYDGTARNCRVDKPYLAIILDDTTNVVLFWASIYQPIVNSKN
ncbi:serpin A3-1-like [Phlebotomus argentipes]|uniref:serpin A3-1-like n=1 Tax=Phlebotomus argentipes TaxID=94469 RepID=UPI002892FC92|nr:serpin A3-1-like [Phlebotomus argentipes]